MRAKTAASTSALILMLGLAPGAMAQTSTNPAADTHRSEQSAPAVQVPQDKMSAEKVSPTLQSGAPAATPLTEQPANTVLGTDLIGKTAYGSDQKKIGTVNDVIMKQDGSGIDGIVVGIGGFLGLGEHNVALTMDKFSFRPSESGRVMIILTSTREELENAPPFKTKMEQEAEAARNAPRPTTAPATTPGGGSRNN